MCSKHYQPPIVEGPGGPVFKKPQHDCPSGFAQEVDSSGKIKLQMELDNIQLEPQCYYIMDDKQL